MPYRAAKISFDGSHYIATPKENFPRGKNDEPYARSLRKTSKSKSNSKPPTRKAKNYRLMNAKPTYRKQWGKLSPIRNSVANTA